MNAVNMIHSVFLTTLISHPVPAHANFDDLRAIYRQARDQGRYRHPESTTLQTATALFTHSLSGRRDPELVRSWEKLGFVFFSLQGNEIWVLREIENRGRGLYFFRASDSLKTLVVPHSFHDRFTGSLGLDWFCRGEWRAIAFNTINRNQMVEGEHTLADLARLEHSFLQAFSRAWSQTEPNGWQIQLHGFAAAKRSEPNASKADIIFSSGTRQPSQIVYQLKDRFQRSQIANVLLFPIETQELGATTNRQGRLLQSLGRGSFIHLELSETFRKRLMADDQLNLTVMHMLAK